MTADLYHHDPKTLDLTLNAAARVFARHGLHGLDMASVAREVSCETGLDSADFRRAFPTRLDLACAIALHSARSLVRDQLADREPGAPRERLERLVRRHIDHFRHHRTEEDLRRAVLPALRAVHPGRHRELAELRQSYRDHLRAVVAEGAAQGRFRVTDPGAAAAAVLEALESVLNWYDPDDGLTAAELGDVYTDLIVHHHLGGPRE
ncbi:TetR/AcrR family transcriptional regulator [Streptomonospora sp. DSM 45055]|uniref:TetR/AcrR family transcriptional regulator n=2 Tax=Streptomonospora wellingtoniae TaxID=3075544 RepID=A0ABU2KVP0_9ACTN|nr:TetR/AcrR family transcriptional regulator [Streptomonospora sp. DSM 45055]